MDYKARTENIKKWAEKWVDLYSRMGYTVFSDFLREVGDYIIELLSRAEEEEARAKKAESNAKYWEGVAANWKYTFSNESQARREAETRCKRLDEARERANEACAKWEGKFRMAEARVRELETTHRIEMCDNGPECVELGKVRKALAEAEAKAEKAEMCIVEIENAIKFQRHSAAMLWISEYRSQREE